MYHVSIVGVVGLWVLLHFYNKRLNSQSKETSTDTAEAKDKGFKAFQLNYLAVYLLAMLSDWMQGPYVYALYKSYGFTTSQTAQLFVMGFASSGLVGTFVGALSDKYGRKKMCILFAVCYILSALTKTIPSFEVLALGRFLSGVATSLLYSAFEAWMVCEHFKRGYSSEQLSDTFSIATASNGIIAVVSGLFAEQLVNTFGFVSPFLFIILPLSILIILVLQWPENYGDASRDVYSTLNSAVQVMKNDRRIVLLGGAQAAFEGSMYAFVFLWSPAMTGAVDAAAKAAGLSTPEKLPFGAIFAAFMAAVSAGSKIFSIYTRSNPISKMPFIIHGAAAAAMFSVVAFYESPLVMYGAFLVFEATCGMFWPTYGSLRSKIIPEDNRAAIANFFRVPLNAFVVILLLNTGTLSNKAMFGVTTLAHLASLTLYSIFSNESKAPKLKAK